MNPPDGPPKSDASPVEASELAQSEATGLPGFRSWGSVYFVVLASFVLWVALLFTLGALFQ